MQRRLALPIFRRISPLCSQAVPTAIQGVGLHCRRPTLPTVQRNPTLRRLNMPAGHSLGPTCKRRALLAIRVVNCRRLVLTAVHQPS